MKLVSTKTIAKVAAVATGLAMFTAVSTFALSAQASALTPSQVSAIVSLLQSFGADSATIANVQASLNGQPTTTTTTTTTGGSCSFTRDLTIGSSGADVTALQSWLISKGYSIPAGATGYFGGQTQAAVIAWQKAAGVTPSAGYFGAKSRAAANCSSTTTTTTGTNPGTGNGLKVSLAATSPSGSVLVQGQGIGDLGEFTFGNPTGSAITVTGLTFNRTGVSNDSTINNVYLYQGVNRLTDAAGVSNSQFSFTNAGGLFVVPAGSTVTVAVRADIAGSTSGQQIGVSLVSVASTGTLDSATSFPIMSGYQTISAANLATVSFNATTLPSATTISPQSSFAAWQNTVSISTNPVWVKSMTFTNLGSIDVNSIGNFRLYVDGNQVGSAVPSFNSGRKVTFDLSANPYKLSTQSHIIKVLADVTGGASLTFQLSLQRSSDVLFVDSQLNQPVTAVSGGSTTAFTAVTSGVVTINSVSGSSGVSVSKDPASQSTAVSRGATNVIFATFDFLSSGEATKVSDLFVCAETSLSNGGLKNGKIYLNGVQVGSTKDITECGTQTDFSLGSSLILPAGQTVFVSVYADAQTSTSTNLLNNETATITLKSATSNAQGQSSLNSANVPASDTSGNAVSVSASALTASKFSGYANQTIIPGAQNALLGEFTLAAGSTEGINVNTIGISLPDSTTAGYLQNMKLVDMSTNTQLGQILSTPASGTNSFSLGSNLAIPQSGSKTIGVYGNILSSASSTTAVYNPLLTLVATVTTGTGASTGTSASVASNVTLQQITLGSGSLTVSLGASNPVAANVLAGATDVAVGSFTFAAANSSYTIQKLEVDASTTVAAALSQVKLRYTDANGVVQTPFLTGASGVNSATTTYQFTGLNLLVPANGQADVTVLVSTPTIASGGSGISGVKIVVGLSHGMNFQAQDQSGSLTTSFGSTDLYSNSNSGYGTLVVRKSIPTFAVIQPAATAQPVSGQSLYQFTVAADPAGAIDLDQLAFNVATSGTTASLTSFKLLDVSSGSAVQVGSTQTAITAGVVTFNFGSTTQQIGAGSTKTYQLVATVTTWSGAGTSLSISLAQDTAYVANTNASAVASAYNIVWSDRSASGHTSDTADYTNGYLLRNFVTNTTSYSHS